MPQTVKQNKNPFFILNIDAAEKTENMGIYIITLTVYGENILI